MTAFYKTRGLVLRRWNVGEGDRLVRLLTPDRGKIDVMVQGGSKIVSKLASHLEPYSETDVMVVAGRRSEKVAAADLRRRWVSFVTSVPKKALADAIIEITDYSLTRAQPESRLHALVLKAWEHLDGLTISKVKQRIEGSLLVCAFALRVLDVVGYRPNLSVCIRCGRPLSRSGNRLVIPRGGIVCARCSKSESAMPGRPIDDLAITVLRFIAVEPYARIKRLRVTSLQEREALQTVREFLEYHLEREIRSLRFYAKTNRKGKGRSKD